MAAERSTSENLPLGANDTRRQPESFSDSEIADLLFNVDVVKEIDEFQAKLRRCESDVDRHELCQEAISDLLKRHTNAELLTAAFDRVMSMECERYRKHKAKSASRAGNRKRSNEDDEEEWDRFIGVAVSGSKIISECLAPLKTVSRCWGPDKVQHYKWALRGTKTCKVLCTAANQNPNWDDDACPKIQQLQLRRLALPGRRLLRDSEDPIEQTDLVNLAKWKGKGPFVKDKDPEKRLLPFRNITEKELPAGCGFDKFGVIVPGRFATPNTASSVHSNTISGVEVVSGSPSHSILDTAIEQCVNAMISSTRSHDGAGSSAGEVDVQTEEEHADTTSNIITNQAEGADARLSTGTAEDRMSDATAVIVDSTSEAEDEDEDGQLSTKYPSPEPSNGEGEQQRRSQRIQRRPLHKETASAIKSQARRRASAKVRGRCCPPDVPPVFLSVLEGSANDLSRARIVGQYTSRQGRLCHKHLLRYSELMSNVALSNEKGKLAGTNALPNLHDDVTILKRPRSASMSEITGPTPEKRPWSDYGNRATSTFWGNKLFSRVGPTRNDDDAFRRQVIAELEQKFSHNKVVRGSHGEQTDKLILEILRKSSSPSTIGSIEAIICDEGEATAVVEKGHLNVPLFTESQQHFRWRDGARPIVQLFRRMEDSLDRRVSVQVSSRKLSEDSAELKTFQEVQEHFLGEAHLQGKTCETWTLLDVRSPLPSLLPSFLMGENPRLLHSACDYILAGDTIERARAPRRKWNEWKNVLEWLLLSAGYNTGPHRDGFATWIIVQEGEYGFGWLSNPTDQELDEWMANPNQWVGGQWRDRVIGPGQAIVIPPGLVHYVFRRDGYQTAAIGGHFLSWSDIDLWSRVVVQEVKHSDSTNEDMEHTAPQYASAILKLVSDRCKRGRIRELGGEGPITDFYVNMKVRLAALFQNLTNSG